MSAGKADLFCASALTPMSLTVFYTQAGQRVWAGDGWLAAIHAQAVCYGCASCWISEFQSVPLVRGRSLFTRAGQSSAVMSQKRHSCSLGTLAAGLSAAIRRIKDPRSVLNCVCRLPIGTRAVRVG